MWTAPVLGMGAELILMAWALGADVAPSALTTATRPLTAPGGTTTLTWVAVWFVTSVLTSSAALWPPRNRTLEAESKRVPLIVIIALGRATANPPQPVAQLTERIVPGTEAGTPPVPAVETPPVWAPAWAMVPRSKPAAMIGMAPRIKDIDRAGRRRRDPISARGALVLSSPGRAPARGALPHAMKTYVASNENRERNWIVVDANGQTLGRLATQIADALRGKRKPEYTPHVDTGDFVVVVNAEKISVSGNKRREKLYRRHSGYPGGLKERTLEEMLERRPEEVIRIAVKGMLPRNRLARRQITKLKVYAGPDHPHAAQKPTPMEITT